MASSHSPSPPGQPPPHPDPPRSERQAAVEAGAEVFGYRVVEAVGDTVAFLTCARCGRTPATLTVLPGTRPVDSLLDLVVRCGRCGRDGRYVVTHRVPPSLSPSTSPSAGSSLSPSMERSLPGERPITPSGRRSSRRAPRAGHDHGAAS